LDILVFQQASSSLPPTPTALPKTADNLSVIVEKEALASTEVETSMSKKSLEVTAETTGTAEMRTTGTNDKLCSG